MSNDIRGRSRGHGPHYRVEVYVGGAWRTHHAASITDARRVAESYGATADDALVYRGMSKTVIARHRRSPDGDGARWYKAEV